MCFRSDNQRRCAMNVRDLQVIEREDGVGAETSTAHAGKTQLDRRDFFKVLGGGLLVCLTPMPSWTQESGRGFGGHELTTDISEWMHIDGTGHVKVFTGNVDIVYN